MIKKTITALVLLTISSAAISSTSERKMVLSVEPVEAIHGSLAALFQYKLTDYMALTVPVFFGTNWPARSGIKTMAVITDENYDSSLLFGGGGLGARFFLNNNGLTDGFFAEPRVVLSHSEYALKQDDEFLVDSKRLTILPSLLLGYSWFFNNGVYLSTGLEIGYGYHAKNQISVDKKLATRLADKSSLKHKLWADASPWRLHYDYDISLGFAW
jgi:hypothetical protein